MFLNNTTPPLGFGHIDDGPAAREVHAPPERLAAGIRLPLRHFDGARRAGRGRVVPGCRELQEARLLLIGQREDRSEHRRTVHQVDAVGLRIVLGFVGEGRGGREAYQLCVNIENLNAHSSYLLIKPR